MKSVKKISDSTLQELKRQMDELGVPYVQRSDTSAHWSTFIEHEQVVRGSKPGVTGVILKDGIHVRVYDTSTISLGTQAFDCIRQNLLWKSPNRWNRALAIVAGSKGTRKMKFDPWEVKANAHQFKLNENTEFTATSESAPQKVKAEFYSRSNNEKIIAIPLLCLQYFQIQDTLIPVMHPLNLRFNLPTSVMVKSLQSKIEPIPKRVKKKRKTERHSNSTANKYGIIRRTFTDTELHKSFSYFYRKTSWEFDSFALSLDQPSSKEQYMCFLCNTIPVDVYGGTKHMCHIIPHTAIKTKQEHAQLWMFIPGCLQCNNKMGSTRNGLLEIFEQKGVQTVYKIICVLKHMHDSSEQARRLNSQPNNHESLLEWVKNTYSKPFKDRNLDIKNKEFWSQLRILHAEQMAKFASQKVSEFKQQIQNITDQMETFVQFHYNVVAKENLAYYKIISKSKKEKK